MKTSRNAIWVLIGLVIVAGGIAVWHLRANRPAPTKANTRKVHVGYYGGTCEAPVFIAYENGIFKKHGLDVQLVKLSGDVMKEGIATGKLDAVQTTPDNFIAMAQGLDIVLTDGVHTGCIQAVAPKSSSIKTVADLKGKAVGCESMGGAPMTFLSMELLRLGIDPKKDVEWKVYPSPQLIVAMDKKEIAAFCTWDPFPQMAVNDGKAQVFFSNTATYPYADQYCCYVGVNGKVVRDEPDIARAITASFAEADEWITKNPDRAAQISVDMKYTSGSAALNGALLATYHYLPNDEKKTRDSYRFFLKGMVDLKMLDAGTNIDDLMKRTLVYMGAPSATKPSES